MVAGSASHVRRTDGTLGGSGEPPTTYSKRRVPQRTRPAPPPPLRPPPPQLEPGSPLHHRYAVSDPWRQSPPSWPTLSRPSSSWPLPPAPDASPVPPPRLRSRLVVRSSCSSCQYYPRTCGEGRVRHADERRQSQQP